MWGSTANSDYWSGIGSHDEQIIQPYIESARRFLSEFPTLANAVDLGCGDVNVGSQIRDCCAQFVASDLVPDLVDRNARAFAHLNVVFQCVDIVKDDLPTAELAFIRQVLQHLNNAQIAKVILKLRQYRWLIVSEHVPAIESFAPNRDKPMGPGVRERFGSGVVLTAPPFNLRAIEERLLCEVKEGSGIVRTVANRLAG